MPWGYWEPGAAAPGPRFTFLTGASPRTPVGDAVKLGLRNPTPSVRAGGGVQEEVSGEGRVGDMAQAARPSKGKGGGKEGARLPAIALH